MTEKEKLEAGEIAVQGQDGNVNDNVNANGNASGETAGGVSGWRDYLKSRNKELNLDDDEAVGTYMKGEFERLDKSDEVNKRMQDLISKDKRNAGLLSGIFSGAGENGEEFKMTDYIIENWFDELHGATTAEEAIEKINKKMAQQEEEAAKEAKRDEDANAKFEAMGTALNAAMQKTNTDEATCQKVVDWLYGTEDAPGLYARIPERSVNEDDFVKLIYAFTRDKALDDARNEGIRAGKGARAGAAHRSASAMAQTDLGGGSGEAERQVDENPTASRYGKMGRRFA